MAKKAKSKGFFALDVHQFERIRQTGLGVEEAATYLSLLKSTDQSNVVSSGGVRGGHQADCAIVWCGKTGKGPISRGPCCSASRKCKAHLR